ncbi:MAG: NYN domain-containing protein [Dehalococcoidia bacterium]|nr:NYN domain-containing protein [Dehalococcoidia bacterium]
MAYGWFSVTTIVYIDGLNFYYGAVKGTPHKWVDLEAVCRRLLPRDEIVKIRYFTARLTKQQDDPQRPVRQDMYLRAVAVNPLVEIHYGHFVTRRTRLPLAHPRPGESPTVTVLKSEEKGTDVNLASHLLVDAFRERCTKAVVVSNDSDLAEPIRVAQAECGVAVVVVNPHPRERRSRELQGTDFRQLRRGVVEKCQLPTVLRDDSGTIRKPEGW